MAITPFLLVGLASLCRSDRKLCHFGISCDMVFSSKEVTCKGVFGVNALASGAIADACRGDPQAL
jgi:hypothetical protein